MSTSRSTSDAPKGGRRPTGREKKVRYCFELPSRFLEYLDAAGVGNRSLGAAVVIAAYRERHGESAARVLEDSELDSKKESINLMLYPSTAEYLLRIGNNVRTTGLKAAVLDYRKRFGAKAPKTLIDIGPSR